MGEVHKDLKTWVPALTSAVHTTGESTVHPVIQDMRVGDGAVQFFSLGASIGNNKSSSSSRKFSSIFQRW